MAATTMSSGLRRHIILSMPLTVSGCSKVQGLRDEEDMMCPAMQLAAGGQW